MNTQCDACNEPAAYVGLTFRLGATIGELNLCRKCGLKLSKETIIHGLQIQDREYASSTR